MLAVVALLCCTPSTWAGVYYFTEANSASGIGGLLTPPFAEVSVNASTVTGKVTFDLMASAPNSGKFGSLAFNLGSGLTGADFTTTVTGTGGNAANWEEKG